MKAFGKVLATIFGGIARALGILLVSCGLWLPALFTVVFFIATAATHTSFSGLTAGIFWCGLVLTFAVGLTLAVYLRERRKHNPKKKKTNDKNGQEQQSAQANVMQSMPAYSPYPYPQGYPAYPYPPYPPYGQGVAPQADNVTVPSSNMQVNDTRDLDNKYFGAPPQQNAQAVYAQQPAQATYVQQNAQANYAQPAAQPAQTNYAQQPVQTNYAQQSAQTGNATRYERTASFDADPAPLSYGKTMTRTQEFAADSRLGADELWRRLSGADVPDEQPLLFRTRRDPDLFVYEYSDRYQYWRRTKVGMVLEQTEYKNNGQKK